MEKPDVYPAGLGLKWTPFSHSIIGTQYELYRGNQIETARIFKSLNYPGLKHNRTRSKKKTPWCLVSGPVLDSEIVLGITWFLEKSPKRRFFITKRSVAMIKTALEILCYDDWVYFPNP
jgi:hypothetical protein